MRRFMLSAALVVLASLPSTASELCVLNSLGYIAACPEGNGAVGAEGFATPDGSPCPKTPAPTTRLTISVSNTDPYLTVAPLPDSQTSLYLWHVSDFPSDVGLGVLFCDVLGSIPVIGFESPYSYILSPHPNGTRWALMIDLACLAGSEYSEILGEFKITSPTSVAPGTWGRIKSMYR